MNSGEARDRGSGTWEKNGVGGVWEAGEERVESRIPKVAGRSGKQEKKGGIMQYYTIFCYQKSAQIQEATKIGWEPGL